MCCGIKTTTTKGVGGCSSCATFNVEPSGRLAVVTTTPKPSTLWSSGRTTTDPFLILQNNGNLVLYSHGGSGTAVWQSATGSSSTFSDYLGSSMTPTGCANAAGWGGCLLQGGQYLESPNNQYALDMQTDGNLVIYNRNGPFKYGTSGNPGAFLRLQSDGTLTVMNAANTQVLWQPNPSTTGAVEATLTMQDDGNLVLYGSNGKGGVSAVWQSGTESMYGTAGNYTVLTSCGSTSPSRLSPGQVLAPGRASCRPTVSTRYSCSPTGTSSCTTSKPRCPRPSGPPTPPRTSSERGRWEHHALHRRAGGQLLRREPDSGLVQPRHRPQRLPGPREQRELGRVRRQRPRVGGQRALCGLAERDRRSPGLDAAFGNQPRAGPVPPSRPQGPTSSLWAPRACSSSLLRDPGVVLLPHLVTATGQSRARTA